MLNCSGHCARAILAGARNSSAAATARHDFAVRMTRPHPNVTHLIAIVENDAAARHSFQVLLESEGYRVRTFESGRRFLEAFETLGPCCVLLELRLPDVDGFEVLEAVRRSRASPPVILMTRVPKLPAPERVRRMGAMMLLEKPIEHACLFSAIRMAVDGDSGRETAGLVNDSYT